jgi:hypothetical protein
MPWTGRRCWSACLSGERVFPCLVAVMVADRLRGVRDGHDLCSQVGTPVYRAKHISTSCVFRWAEARELQVRLIERSPGEEAGVKSVEMEVAGPYA